MARRPIDWVVMRNRLSSLDARNKRFGRLLEQPAKRLGLVVLRPASLNA